MPTRIRAARVADAADGRAASDQHARGLSDEQVCAQWLENAYFQYFSGRTYFQTALPLDRPRCRCELREFLKPAKLEALRAETLAASRRPRVVEPHANAPADDLTRRRRPNRRPSDWQPSALAGQRCLLNCDGQEAGRCRPPVVSAGGQTRPAREVGRLMHAGHC